MAQAKKTKQTKNNGANVGYEAELWQMADALRGSMDAAEYKHVVLGLIFLKYISDSFEEQHAKLEAERAQGADPEDPDEYRAITHILGTLVDKIELNRRMNETLEAMARAIFKSWFVDFDPVRAKAEGRDPGLPKHIADLFPNRFEDSELGEIPDGWEVRLLGDLLELAYGKALKEENRIGGKIPVFGSNGQVGWHDEKLANGPCIIVGRKGNPGIITWAPTDFFAIDTTFYVVTKPDCRSLYFLFYVLKTHNLASLGADSAVPGLNRNLVYMSKQVVAPKALLTVFDSFIQPLFQRITEARNESRTLTALRDTLLPKLISGEMRANRSTVNARDIA